MVLAMKDPQKGTKVSNMSAYDEEATDRNDSTENFCAFCSE